MSLRRSAAASSSVPSCDLAPRRRSASPAAPPAAATDRSASTFVPCCWLIWPGMPAWCSQSVSICTRLPSPWMPWLSLDSTISSVIAARSILLASWCRLYCWARSSGLKKSRMSTGLPCVCPCCGVSLGVSRSVKSSSAPSSDRSSWPCPWPCPTSGAADLHQREELVEDLVEDLLVAPVLDQRDAQGGAQLLLVAQHPRLAGAHHRVERLGDRDAHAAQPQQPDEPVDGVLHQRLPPRPGTLPRTPCGAHAHCGRCAQAPRRVREQMAWGGRGGHSARLRPRPAPKLREPRSAGTFGDLTGSPPPSGLLP